MGDEKARRADLLLAQCGIESASLSRAQRTDRAEAIVAAVRRFASADDGHDLGAVFDQHIAEEFVHHDVDKTMQTMVDEPYLDHVPVMTGGVGFEEVRRFYRDHFIFNWPRDTKVERLSRTVGVDQVVDELVVSFTHDVVMDALLPGVAPTHNYVELAHVVVMGFEGAKITHEHIYWDQASLLVQVGLLDPSGLPVTGAEQTRKLKDATSVASNTLITGGEPKPAT